MNTAPDGTVKTNLNAAYDGRVWANTVCAFEENNKTGKVINKYKKRNFNGLLFFKQKKTIHSYNDLNNKNPQNNQTFIMQTYIPPIFNKYNENN